MKLKSLLSVILALAIALISCGCASSGAAAAGTSASAASTDAASAGTSADTTSAETAASGDTITITDQADYQVTLPRDIERIVVCDIAPLPSVLAVFFNSAKKIVGMSPLSMNAAQNSLLGQLYPEILNAATGFIDGSEVNTEELLKLSPDVVFYNASSSQLGDTLRKAGFNAVAVSVNRWNYDCIATLDNWIDLLSQMFPEDAKVDAVKDYSEKIYKEIQDRISTVAADQRPNVFFLFRYDDSAIFTSGKQFFGQYWCDAIGAKNVAEELTTDNSVQVDMEQIYKWNPDLIFITNFTKAQPADLANNSIGSYDWSGITAVQNGRVFKMPLGIYRSYTPGADTPMTLLWLAKTAYPDLFADIDLVSEVKTYYQTIFGVELTDDQVNSIFAPSSAVGAGF